MILHLELPAEIEARFTAEAQEQNLSLEDYALRKLLALSSRGSGSAESAGEAILRLTQETFGILSLDELARMPTDFAVNHDHYIHGAPKVQK